MCLSACGIYVVVPYNAVNFLTNIHKRHPIARMLGLGMVYSEGPAFDWYSASVTAIIYTISYYIGLHYNGTWLYYCSLTSGQPFTSIE